MSSLHLSVYLPTSTYQWCEQKQKHKQLQWSLDLASDIWQFKRSLQFPQYANKYNPSTGTIAHHFQFRVLIYSFSVSMSAKLKQATHQRYIHETGLKRQEMLHIIWSSMYPWFQPHTWRSYNQKVSVCNARVTRTWSRDCMVSLASRGLRVHLWSAWKGICCNLKGSMKTEHLFSWNSPKLLHTVDLAKVWASKLSSRRFS